MRLLPPGGQGAAPSALTSLPQSAAGRRRQSSANHLRTDATLPVPTRRSRRGPVCRYDRDWRTHVLYGLGAPLSSPVVAETGGRTAGHRPVTGGR